MFFFSLLSLRDGNSAPLLLYLQELKTRAVDGLSRQRRNIMARVARFQGRFPGNIVE